MQSPTKHYVDSFAKAMEGQLDKPGNRAKGNADGWRAESVDDHVAAVEKHLARLKEALLRGVTPSEVQAIAADGANRLMMAADTYKHDAPSVAAMAREEADSTAL